MIARQEHISFEAHKHHLMLHLGLETAIEVVAWADEMIRTLDEPPAEIIAISEATHEAEIDLRHRLEPLMKDPRVLGPLRPVFGMLAGGLESGRIQAHDIVMKLAGYGVTDSTGSTLLPDDLMTWVDALVYECVNIHYVYPDSLLKQGVDAFRYDVFAGCKSIAETGAYHFRIRPAVEQARRTHDATAKPVLHGPQSPSVLRRLASWLGGGRQR